MIMITRIEDKKFRSLTGFDIFYSRRVLNRFFSFPLLFRREVTKAHTLSVFLRLYLILFEWRFTVKKLICVVYFSAIYFLSRPCRPTWKLADGETWWLPEGMEVVMKLLLVLWFVCGTRDGASYNSLLCTLFHSMSFEF